MDSQDERSFSSRLESGKVPADCKRLKIISLRCGECGERKKSSWGDDVRWGLSEVVRAWRDGGQYISQNFGLYSGKQAQI